MQNRRNFNLDNRKNVKTIIPRIILPAFGLLTLLATMHSSLAQSINITYVTVGNPGNAPDPATGSIYGSVFYTYNISEYDVTDAQYCAFLNAVDPAGNNTLKLYLPRGDAEYGITFNPGLANGLKYSVIPGYANMPVVDVDYWDTLRFANYLDDGKTETGAYTLTGGVIDDYGTPSNAAALLANPQHNAGATVWLPSENEWYKAAHYDPVLNGTGGYWKYATQSNVAPGNIVGNGSNEANYIPANGLYSVTQSGTSTYNTSLNYLTAVGSFTASPSYYGTYDQAGDVWNWTSTVISGSNPVMRGGNWFRTSNFLSSSYRLPRPPTYSSLSGIGFRVASIAAPLRYTVLLTATSKSASIPQGTGYATLTVGIHHGCIMAGSLPDNEQFSDSGTLVSSTNGYHFVVNETLAYPSVTSTGAKGSLVGTLTFATLTGTSDLSGTLKWIKPQQSTGQYPTAINTNIRVIGSLYTYPTGNSVLPGFTTGTLDLTDSGKLSLSGTTHLNQAVVLTSTNTLNLTAPIHDKLTVAVSPSTGVFKGTFVYPGKTTPTAFAGVLFQDQTKGGGFFLGPDGSGSVTLTP